MAKIAISINEVLRDFIGQLTYTYDKYIGESNIKESDVTSFNLLDHFKFEDIDHLNRFLYLEAPLEIFGHADQLHNGVITELNNFLMDMEDDGEHQVELVSREVNKAIPSTFFFFTKTGARPTNIRFVNSAEKKWDGVDILVTANPIALAAKPENGVSVKVRASYNQDAKADFEIDSIFEFFKNTELRERIIAMTNTITIEYEEI